MTTKDKFVTAVILSFLVAGDHIIRLWWGWVQYVTSFLWLPSPDACKAPKYHSIVTHPVTHSKKWPSRNRL